MSYCRLSVIKNEHTFLSSTSIQDLWTYLENGESWHCICVLRGLEKQKQNPSFSLIYFTAWTFFFVTIVSWLAPFNQSLRLIIIFLLIPPHSPVSLTPSFHQQYRWGHFCADPRRIFSFLFFLRSSCSPPELSSFILIPSSREALICHSYITAAPSPLLDKCMSEKWCGY